MNKFLLLGISMISNLSSGIVKKNININYENNNFSYQFFNCVVSFFTALFLFVFSTDLHLSSFTIIISVIFGIVTLIQQITNLMAIENGPLSYTSVIISLSTLIPTLSGVIWWNEKISFLQYIGIGLLVLSLILSVDFKNNQNKANIKWLLSCLCAFVCTGLIGVMQKIHQSSQFKNELDSFLIIAFLISFLMSLILSIIFRNKHNSYVYKRENNILQIKPILFMIISGLFVALNNKINLHLSGIMDSAVFFPLVNGGGLILTTIAAIVIFKEKLNKLQTAGLISGIFSAVLLCLS